MRPLTFLLVVVSATLAPPVSAQTFAPRCQDPEFRAFDFWIGEWVVTDPDGVEVGRSVIERALDGCVIREGWDSGQVRGMSLSMYDRPNDRWTQTWVDNRGVLLVLAGGAREGGSMHLAGERLGRDGRVRQRRVTWSRLPEGGVRQLQEVSEDGGATWAVAFDGRYRRVTGG